MGLNIKNPTTEAAIRLLAEREGVSLTEAVDRGVNHLLALGDEERRRDIERRMQLVREIQEAVRRAPSLDPRPLNEIMDAMYDEHGLPT